MEKRLTPVTRRLRRDATNIERSRAIEAAGYTVFRFWNNEVIENFEGVLELIHLALLNPRSR